MESQNVQLSLIYDVICDYFFLTHFAMNKMADILQVTF